MDINLVNLFTLPKEVMENLTILKSELATFVELNRKVSQEPQKIVIVGGGVYSPGFVEFFKEFNTPVYVGNCLRRVLVTEDYKPYVYPIVSQLATALGLALREDI
jgi:pyruvate/2-oxoglutarate dehydrogenase complex dihydrolipoamide dehydrogenase (E3) component